MATLVIQDSTPFTLPKGDYAVTSPAGTAFTFSINGSTPAAVVDTAGNIDTPKFFYESVGEVISVTAGYPVTFTS